MMSDIYEELLPYIYTHQHGNLSELKKDIGEDSVMNLIYINYIKRYLCIDGTETWRITDDAIKAYKLFCCEPTLFEKIMGVIYYYIFGFNRKYEDDFTNQPKYSVKDNRKIKINKILKL